MMKHPLESAAFPSSLSFLVTGGDHPLEGAVREAFAKHQCLNENALAYLLAGRGSKSYTFVARDVLGYLLSQGKLERGDAKGWWRWKKQ
jgi:hypothetical protein